MKNKFSGKRYFYWMGANDMRYRKGRQNKPWWPIWAKNAYANGYFDESLRISL